MKENQMVDTQQGISMEEKGTTYMSEVYGVSFERSNELDKLNEKATQDFQDGKISSCQMAEAYQKSTDVVGEQLYLAYVVGAITNQNRDEFDNFFGSMFGRS